MAGSRKQIAAAANARRAIGNQAALVKGSAAAKARMAQLRAMRQPGVRKNITPRGAKAAFTRFYNRRSYKSPRARKAAMTRDMCSANKPVITDRRYLRSPHRYDYRGWDDGSNCPAGRKVHRARKASPAQAAALARGRATRAAQRGGAAEHCAWNEKSQRCNKATSGGVHGNCKVNAKGNCAKSPVAPKSAAAQARGRALGASRKGVKRAARAPAPPAMPAEVVVPVAQSSKALRVCKDMEQADCTGKAGKLMGCAWSKVGKAKSPSCHQTGTLSHSGPRAKRAAKRS